jgi:DNA-directed RNA polymerase beta' subunit
MADRLSQKPGCLIGPDTWDMERIIYSKRKVIVQHFSLITKMRDEREKRNKQIKKEARKEERTKEDPHCGRIQGGMKLKLHVL